MTISYEVCVEDYNGPLQGLLESARSEDVPVREIHLTELIEDFANYVQNNLDWPVNAASSYLLIFSELIRIKTRLLLPKPDDPVENEDPFEAESTDFFQTISKRLENRAKKRSKLYENTPASLPDEVTKGEVKYKEVTLYELIKAFQQILVTTREDSSHTLEITNEFDTTNQMEYILDLASVDTPMNFMELLSSSPSREEIIVTFLAILQLVKQNDLRLIKSVDGGHIAILRSTEKDE